MLRWNDRTAPKVVHIGAFKLFPSRRLLMRDAEVVKVGSRSFDILLALAERPGEVVSQKELIAKVWPGIFVEDVSLRVHVAALRKALDCDGSRCLSNVPRPAYCLIAPPLQRPMEQFPGSFPS